VQCIDPSRPTFLLMGHLYYAAFFFHVAVLGKPTKKKPGPREGKEPKPILKNSADSDGTAYQTIMTN